MSRVDEGITFRGTIFRRGIQRIVLVPTDIGNQLGDGAKIPVLVGVGDEEQQTTLMSVAGGGYRLFVNGAMRRAAGVDTGDEITVRLRRDTGPREPLLADDVRRALETTPGAIAAYLAFSPSHKRELIGWIDAAKRAQTRANRIKKAMSMLLKR